MADDFPLDPGGLDPFPAEPPPAFDPPAPPIEPGGGGSIDPGRIGPGEQVGRVDTLPGGGGGGLMDFAKGLFGDKTSPVSMLAQTLGLGATGLGIANQFGTAKAVSEQSRLARQAQETARTAAAPAVSFGTEQLNLARAGKLPAPMEASIAQWVQQAKADMRARLAKMGQGNSTNITTLDSQIDQMALSMKAQMLTQQEQTGLAGIQTGVGAVGTGATIGQDQQQYLSKLLEGATAQLAKLGAAA